jgi:hypothetical protein
MYAPKKLVRGVRGKRAAPARCVWPVTGPQINFLGHTFLLKNKCYIADGKKKTMRLDVGV